MITGDNKLSPDNIGEVKAATQKSNINGDKVKVILISQAGSEGLDFKFLRQVHILEPWYNLSRIEQIIGRAVRHCSHKDLSLEERNVQIFLYGSELVDNIIEPADLYVYRLAEQKEITHHIDIELKKFDLLVSKAEVGIELIKERKTALISAAVTGKIDLRDWKSQGI